jgi:Concanavalin A-like lectin/glucanases superfamily
MDIEPYSTIMRYAPLCYWRMNEASGSLVNSGSAASKNATVTNLTYSATKIASRSPVTAVTFNGTTHTAEVAAGVIGGVTPQFSVGAWIRTTASGGDDVIISQRDGTNGNSGFLFYMSSGAYLGLQGVTTAGVNDFSFLSEQLNTLNDGIPHYVSFTAYSDTVIIYCDGMEVGNYAGRAGGTWSAIPKIYLGLRNASVDRFDGTMSDVFITSQVLTQADHYKIWRNGMVNAATSPGSNFLDATTISVPVASTTLTSFDLATRTIEPPLEPIPLPLPAYTKGINSLHSAWFKFTSTAAGDRMRVSSVSNPASTCYHYLELYKSTDGTIEGLEEVTNSVGYVNSVSVIVEATTTYYLRVRSYYQFANVLNLTYIYDTPPAPPANDNFINATTINVTSAGSITGQLDGSTVEFPLETDNYTSSPNSVWYKFVADATGNITFDTELTSPFNDMVLQGFEGDLTMAALEADPYLAPYYDNDTGPGGTVLMTMAVISGNTYYIQASDFGTLGNFTMRWTDIV